MRTHLCSGEDASSRLERILLIMMFPSGGGQHMSAMVSHVMGRKIVSLQDLGIWLIVM
jgi:hypothetical protein